MAKRRSLLIAASAAVLGGLGWLIFRSPGNILAASGAEPLDDQLRADMERQGERVKSEEGILMFLACEDLAPKTASKSTARAAGRLNKDLALAFRQNSDAWLRMYPDAPDKDVARIIEVLVDRDLAMRAGNQR